MWNQDVPGHYLNEFDEGVGVNARFQEENEDPRHVCEKIQVDYEVGVLSLSGLPPRTQVSAASSMHWGQGTYGNQFLNYVVNGVVQAIGGRGPR